MRYTILILSYFLLFLSCCGQKEPILTLAVGGAPSEVRYWGKILEEFEDTTGTKVKMLRQSTDTNIRRQSLVIPLKAHKCDPDIFLMDVAWVAQFAVSHWLLPLDPYIRRDNFSVMQLFSQVVNQVDVYQGKIVALPVYIDCGLFYFRKDLLTQYRLSIPETWEEVVKYATIVQKGEKKKNPQFYGFVWQGAQYEGLVCNFIEFISSHKGKILNSAGNIEVDCPENIEALKYMRDLIHTYKISPLHTYTEMKEEETRMLFENKSALFERNWPYAWKLHESSDSPIRGNVGITILPKFSHGTHATTLGGWHIGISRYSDAKESAWDLVRFILSYDTQKKLALHLGWNPSRKDIYDDHEVRKTMPHIETLKRALTHAVARPNIPYYTQISEVLQKYVNAAISGKMLPDKALAQAQRGIEKIEKAYHK
ncbi:MAG: ABC transporter substrate-binding protein [Thermodesulfobacteriota bacterium]|nr:ABC transporter substrate-binding protein [Thermodesulfobacteriota bacterium]